jgi:hypothetical protein
MQRKYTPRGRITPPEGTGLITNSLWVLHQKLRIQVYVMDSQILF